MKSKLLLFLGLGLATGCAPEGSRLLDESSALEQESTTVVELNPETPGVVLPALEAIASAQAGLFGSEKNASYLRRNGRLHSDRFDIIFDRSSLIIHSRYSGDRTRFNVTEDSFTNAFQISQLSETDAKLIAGISGAFRDLTSYGDEVTRFRLADGTKAAPIFSVVRWKRPDPEKLGVVYEVAEVLGTFQFVHNGIILNPIHLQPEE